MNKKLAMTLVSLILVSACSSVNSSEGFTPEQASAIASQASEAAAEAADEFVEEYQSMNAVAGELETVALAIKAYADLGKEMEQTGSLDLATLDKLSGGLVTARAAADDWTAFANGLPASETTPALRQDLDAFTGAVDAYLADQEGGYKVWERCLRTQGKRDLEAATCIFGKLDVDRSVEVFEDYVTTLKALGAELGMNVT